MELTQIERDAASQFVRHAKSIAYKRGEYLSPFMTVLRCGDYYALVCPSFDGMSFGILLPNDTDWEFWSDIEPDFEQVMQDSHDAIVGHLVLSLCAFNSLERECDSDRKYGTSLTVSVLEVFDILAEEDKEKR